MTTKAKTQITQRKIFGMKRTNLEKAIIKFYQETKNAALLVEYAVAIMVRNSLVIGDFQLLFPEQIREIFLHAEPTRMLRKFCPFFELYFAPAEWEQVKARMFKHPKEFRKLEDELRPYKDYLYAQTTAIEELDGQQYKIISVFEDASGKLHTWNLGDADPNIAIEKADAMLKLLTTLTIFRKNDVRRFVKLEKSDIVNCTRKSLVKKEKIQDESDQDTADLAADDALAFLDDEDFLNDDNEKTDMIDMTDMKVQPTAVNTSIDENSNTTTNQLPGTSNTGTLTKEKTTSPTEKPAMALSAYEKMKINLKKPKSKKQEKKDHEQELYKKTPQGRKKKGESRKKRKKR